MPTNGSSSALQDCHAYPHADEHPNGDCNLGPIYGHCGSGNTECSPHNKHSNGDRYQDGDKDSNEHRDDSGAANNAPDNPDMDADSERSRCATDNNPVFSNSHPTKPSSGVHSKWPA